MVNLGKIIYEKEFPEEKRTKNISTHGSPIMQDYWGENYEDERIKMDKTFSLNIQTNNYLNFGSDGTFNYTFQPFGCPIIKENKGNNPNIYIKQYLIEKTGNRRDKEKLSDIEIFLLSKGFIKSTSI